MYHFLDQVDANERALAARSYKAEIEAIPVEKLADNKHERSVNEWVRLVKQAALDSGADQVGICKYLPEWTYVDRQQPMGKWAVVMAFSHDYDALNSAPDVDSLIEVMNQYGRAGKAAKHLTNWIADQGYLSEAKTGPNSEDVLMIPAAIAAGLGELGKHGSMINRQFGSNFRLSMITTDLPLAVDQADVFGADDFCTNCQICTNACPPDAIAPDKQMVRGETKWYVDFDKCVPYFVDNFSCGICIAVCPWSRPGIGENLVKKMAVRRARQ
jgi:epoxyqueuosine reductase